MSRLVRAAFSVLAPRRAVAKLRCAIHAPRLNLERNWSSYTARCLSLCAARAMGAGESKEGGSGRRWSTKKEKQKETASVATSVEGDVAPTGKEDGGDEFVECTVAKASEFGENE